MVELILRSLQLKEEARSGWVLRGVTGPESVADHSWATAYLCLLYAGPAGVDGCRAVSMAVVHDLAEAVTGDVATRVAEMSDPGVIAEKRRRETAGMQDLLTLGDGCAVDAGARTDTVQQLWEEYEESATPVARFVRDMNLIDMCAQALRYEEAARYDPVIPNHHFPDFQGMDEFFATTRPRLATAVGRELFDRLVERYSALPRVRERGGPRLESGTE